jgi:hypothetical protein
MEGHDARVGRAAPAPPRDAVVTDLLGDLGFPRLLLAAHVGAPQEPLVAELLHLQDAFHELREILELRPLVVGGADRDGDVDGLLDLGHAVLLLHARDRPRLQQP